MTERMLDTSITATSFDRDADGGPLPDRPRVVIVGGGVIGASIPHPPALPAARRGCGVAVGGVVGAWIAYHLAGLGIADVVVLERQRIASGTSWHAAGLVARVRGSDSVAKPSASR